jgi:hypothetical protein
MVLASRLEARFSFRKISTFVGPENDKTTLMKRLGRYGARP